MDKGIFLEVLKAFSLGVLFGLIFVYFTDSKSYILRPIVFGLFFVTMHASNNSYKKPEQK
ncbi:hypothetical protein [Flavobacterium aquatile]|uniref:Uncharacterized protein n=1 Tax=Flavobacterium aquatile LMG 4008 = ATCC 11947 TaxID=1453498 RepID=A0A095SXX7_9FLAO|nr:hypothetical protein [Flavobacterium aquatile]KGD69199.1 hypothetical protein LG45_06085 [Flavobacterium aquatile LMG 4008 = ATCC 11947]OXA65902.1 hypothetical protein B0A61_14815 [Flavobacterium aquatile LMG 4008 = ATCC 11947]GEC79635.1 hypothetical protein FAQ01_25050 [Flavobacterium aquatile]